MRLGARNALEEEALEARGTASAVEMVSPLLGDMHCALIGLTLCELRSP